MKETKVYYVGPGTKMTTYFREGATCTMSEFELLEIDRELRRYESWAATRREHSSPGLPEEVKRPIRKPTERT